MAGSPDCLSGKGYNEGEQIRTDAVKKASTILQIEALVIAIDNATRLVDNYKKQRDISKRTGRIAKEEHDHLKNVFHPRELEFLKEFGTARDREEVEVRGRRLAGRLRSTIAAAFAKEIHKFKCNAPRYCTSHRAKSLQDLMLARAESLANASLMGRVMAFAEIQELKATDDKRRGQALALKQGLAEQAAKLYKAAADGYSQASGTLSQQLGRAIEQVGFGYADPGRDSLQEGMLSHELRGSTAPFNIEGMGVDVNNPSSAFTSLSTHSGDDSAVSLRELGRMDRGSTFRNNQEEYSMNEAYVGNRDKVRTGSHTYTDYDHHGKPINITVNMKDFAVDFADQNDPGSYPA